MILNVRYEGEEWLGWDSEELTVQEMLLIEEETGFARIQGPGSLLVAAYGCEARGAQALIWWLRGHHGHAAALADLKPGKLRLEMVTPPDEDEDSPKETGDSAPNGTVSSATSRTATTGRRIRSTG